MGRRGPLPGAGKPAAAVPTAHGVQPSPADLPPPPSWLGEIAAAEYTRIAAEMPSLHASDVGALCAYAQAFGEVATHTLALDGDGTNKGEGYTTKGDRGAVLNPRVRALDRARLALLAAAKALGLTPEARLRSSPTANSSAPQAGGPAAFASEHGSDSA